MAIAVPPSLNGRPRKQLSDQLDRMDDLINGLEECLPQAVAEAARDGIRQAFRDVMSEIVTDPAVLDKLRSAISTEIAPPFKKPGAFSRLKTMIKAAAARTGAFVTGGIVSVASTPRRVATSMKQGYAATKTSLAHWMLLALPLKSIVSVGLVFGVVVAAISYIAPHHVAALISGIGASVTAMAMQTVRWLRGRRRLLAALS